MNICNHLIQLLGHWIDRFVTTILFIHGNIAWTIRLRWIKDTSAPTTHINIPQRVRTVYRELNEWYGYTAILIFPLSWTPEAEISRALVLHVILRLQVLLTLVKQTSYIYVAPSVAGRLNCFLTCVPWVFTISCQKILLAPLNIQR